MTNREPFFTGVPGYQNHYVRQGEVVENTGQPLGETEPLSPEEISPELALAVDAMTRANQGFNHINLIEEPTGEHSL